MTSVKLRSSLALVCALLACHQADGFKLKPGEAGLHMRLIADATDGIGSIRVDILSGQKVVDSQTVVPGPLVMPNQNPRLGGDAYFALRPGDYGVQATPFDTSGQPSKVCTTAYGKATAVAGQTAEIVLTLFCSDQGTGGVDVVVTTDHPPVITNLTFAPSKITTTCEGIGIRTTAKDADNDILAYAYSVTSVPAKDARFRLSTLGAEAKFVSATVGDYQLRVDVTDKNQHTTGLSFPVHVGYGVDASCLDDIPAPPPNTPVQSMARSPASLALNVPSYAKGSLTTSTKVETPLTFAVRGDHEVAGGIIANGVVSFGFLTPAGVNVVCTWKGDAPTSTPSTPDELTRGRLLRFAGCSDGLPAEARRQGVMFQLGVQPAAGYPVTVTSPVTDDGACSDDLELLTADQTKQMHDSFDWRLAHAVDEKTPDGRFALYYAWIYLRNGEGNSGKDALALKQLLIQPLTRPLFTAELDKYAGKCGVVSNPGDGRGTFVPALIPGSTYNKLVAVAQGTTDPPVSGDKIVFEAVVLRDDVPAEARNADGSVRLDVLASSGFRYLPDMARPFGDWRDIKLDGGVAAAIEGALEWLATAVRDAVNGITDALAELDATFGAGRINLTLFIGAITDDPSFAANQPMVRAWGPGMGQLMGARGMKVSVLQRFAGTPIPMTSTGATDDFGHVVLNPVRNADPLGSGLCITMEARAAIVTDFLLASEVCDLRAFDPARSTAPSDFMLSDFSADHFLSINVENVRLMGLYEASDVFKYMADQAGFQPKRARILSGYWATTFSSNRTDGTKRLYTPCMNYPNSASDTLVAVVSGGSLLTSIVIPDPIVTIGATVFASVIANTDIVMSEQSNLRTSREVMSHEYGHYEFCSLLEQNNPFSVDHIIWSTIVHGDDQSWPLRYVNEAMADVFAGQVAGADDYLWLPGGRNYCTADAPDQCFDANENRSSTDPNNVVDIGRVASMIHDMLDGHGARGLNLPDDADLWTRDPSGKLVPALASYGNRDFGLERVALNAESLNGFAHYASLGLGPWGTGPSITDQAIYNSLSSTMADRGVSWCDRCRVMGLHVPSSAPANVRQLFETCGADATLQAALGAAPDPDLRLDAASCTPCPSGYVSNDDGVCVACAGTVHGNRCDICPTDVVLDGNTLPLTFNSFDTTVSAPGDVCPDVFVVELRNPQALFARDATLASIVTHEYPAVNDQTSCEVPWSLTTAHDAGGVFSTDFSSSSMGRWACYAPSPTCTPSCQDIPSRTYFPADVSGSTLRFQVPGGSGKRFAVDASLTPG